ncbi:MAG: hypothetical protein B6I25_02145 [Planctomycetales bacterium 4572_13]|nr:MAG: hypothetical protein B6I25_02145 [Planctomycetales bacterium 4572_13]
MKIKSKDLLITVMALFVIALMVLMYKVNTLVIDRVPQHIAPEVYVMDLTEAIERQNQICTDSSYAMGWLKRHLENCLTLIETERGLEPIPISPMGPYPLPSEKRFPEATSPFVVPYEKPKSYLDSSKREKNLRVLECLVNLSAMSATMARYNVERNIDNFQQRLERIAADPNSP